MKPRQLARRRFLGQVGLASGALLPWKFGLEMGSADFIPAPLAHLPGEYADARFSPHYPAPSPLDGMLKLLVPGTDRYVCEKYAMEIGRRLNALRDGLPNVPLALATILGAQVSFNEFQAPVETVVRASGGIRLVKRDFSKASDGERASGREKFVAVWRAAFGWFASFETAEFEIIALKVQEREPLRVEAGVRYSFVGAGATGRRQERIGKWKQKWKFSGKDGGWLVEEWDWLGESLGEVAAPIFSDVTAAALGSVRSYKEQLLPGIDHWRTVLDGASGIDVYGNHGVAAGDFDNDGFDDFYVCQPGGLPNRLYRNRGDGTFEDVTDRAGVGVLDATACALFADFDNRGAQDLLVVCTSGPLLFQNDGRGKFTLKPDAFRFAQPPQGTFTHAAIADYDRDGKLDVYFCLYSYYLGLDQYHYPAPYFDARNGPPNFLFRNEGGGNFVDRTQAAELNAENDRFSFACAWGAIDSAARSGPDLYVANDFGRSNLYRNRGDGTFEAVSDAARVNDPGAGMSACWADFSNSGQQDIYVSNMWSAAGLRVSVDELFHPTDKPEDLAHYRRHARGNSFYRNKGAARFDNASADNGTELGRWAWGADAWDFDHDGFADLYIANGYITGTADSTGVDAGSFFWRQVVGNSPAAAVPAVLYERGWNAINETIRSDGTWNGNERNTFFLNNRDGSFSEISGLTGLDYSDDSRCFALADIDGDGKPEVLLKNRTSPQVRVLKNELAEIGNCVSFRLRGTKSNRDAIGAAVTVESGGLRQTKYLQAGSGFLSQHSKELFFGVGNSASPVRARVQWPSGLLQTLENVPVNQRISVVEGEANFGAAEFSRPLFGGAKRPAVVGAAKAPDTTVATWLLDPVPAPEFTLKTASGEERTLRQYGGQCVLLHFWSAAAPACLAQLKSLSRDKAALAAARIELVCVNTDGLGAPEVRSFLERHSLSLPALLADAETGGVYNLLYRYLFDRRRDLPLPSAFLLNESSEIVKVYQGVFEARQFAADAANIPRSNPDRERSGLPFSGKLHFGAFRRNEFTAGIAFFQRGYLDQAAAAFKQVVAAKPDNPEAYYNLGTLYLRKNDLPESQKYLYRTVKLRPEYPEAWNNLGMIAVQQNRVDEAVRHFSRSLKQRPDYVTALLNLGNLCRRQGDLAQAAKFLGRAAELEPENAEAAYSLGMLYARQNDFDRAVALLQKAAALRTNYADAINNLGVLYVQQGKNEEAERQFKRCIGVAPNFDQGYLNLARLYMLMKEKEKARDTLQALLQLQPEHKVAQQALGMLN
jgi:Flp pilus assembly protein TadD/peroxiredoxin